MEMRVFHVPIKRGRFSYLAVNDENHILYLRHGEESALQSFDPNSEKREEKTVLKKVDFVQMTPDGKKLLMW